MKLSVRTIATAAFAVFVIYAFNATAEGAARPSGGNASDEAVESSSNPEPAAPLSPVPMLGAQMAGAQPGATGSRPPVPKVELFLGYSYIRAVPTLAEGNRLMWLNGGSASIAFNLNRYLGIVGDFGGFDDSQIRLSTSSPAVVKDSSGNLYTYLFGPRLSFRGSRLTPFVQALFGGARASDVTLSGCTTGPCTLLPTENQFAMTAGGGLDLRVHHRFAIRIVQAEYLMTRFDDFNTGKSASQNDIRLSSGIVFRFGGAPRAAPLPPLSYSCSVNPTTVYAGDPITVSGTGLNLSPAKTATYTWSADGGTVSGSSERANIDTANLAPGNYTVKGHISEGVKPEENADCTAAYTVRANEPPTVGCSASPSTVTAAGSSTITANGVSPQNRTLTYSFETSSGSVTGSGSTATLSTIGAPAGDITVTCKVADDKGQSASASTTVTVIPAPVAAKPITSSLCSIQFDRDVRRPARVNNEAKACLDDIALNLQRNSDAKLALVGSVASNEKGGNKLAAQRAVNTKAYLVGDKGIDATRVEVYTGSQGGETVTTTLIPPGAMLDTTGDTPVDESTIHQHPAASRTHRPGR